MKTFNELILAHKGKVICIMGGSDSLQSDLEQIKADIYISTNGHGCEFQKPDYVLAMDETNRHVGRPMRDTVREKTDAPIISPRSYADYQLLDWPQAPRDVLSGMVATWCAFMMGAKVVILAGMDGYKDKGFIFEAVKMARDVHCPVRVMSDEMTKAWPMYDPAEKFGRYKPHPAIDTWAGKVEGFVTVECLKPTSLRGNQLVKGQKIQASRHEVARLLKHKMLREVA